VFHRERGRKRGADAFFELRREGKPAYQPFGIVENSIYFT
jgi:hypothetical protein